jgi:hypothetical protein
MDELESVRPEPVEGLAAKPLTPIVLSLSKDMLRANACHLAPRKASRLLFSFEHSAKPAQISLNVGAATATQ